MLIVDSHCHLDHFVGAEQEEVVARAKAAGVGVMVTIGTRLGEQAATVRAIADKYEGVFATVGIHPHNAGEGEVPDVQDILAEADHPRVVGIGESGLDYFYDKAPRAVQQAGFRRHIAAARQSGLPLVIHARDADADMAAILEDEDARGKFPFLLHCFSSGAELARTAVRLGGYISFSGMLTFPKSDAIRAVAAETPADRLLVETDSPYLAPVPLRGKRCEPAYVVHTAARLAEVRGLGIAALADLTTSNFRRLFARAI
ncbi:TatD family hydrolase [Falsiroseomonas tokyonensis]|uniref:TatD family hydrolase n=1 Tax=Falsiroseomonas tokyonensis TaxID=430521 RepID=A0ABV7BRS7_9PROT|nr:TatD family hydrolase [Falsiroseomonas tokyonensis]MBU8538245.1 TatD family hydrolase [Falsiroseomonas tokyonensis]